MRVAQLLFSGSFAGAEAVGCALSQALTRVASGPDDEALLCIVAETRAGRRSCEELIERAAAYETELVTFKTATRYNRKLIDDLRSEFSRRQIDIVHNHSDKGAILMRGFKGPATRKGGNVYSVHGFDHTSLKKMAFQHATTLAALNIANRTIAVSENVATVCRRLAPHRRKPEIIANLSMDELPPRDSLFSDAQIAAREAFSDKHGVPRTGVWFGIAARLVPIKNHNLLIEAFAAACQQGLDGQLLIAGDGPMRSELEAKVQDLAPGRIHLLGQVSNIPEFYRAIDVSVLTSNSEGSPIAIIEALSYARPIVATSVGSIPDLVAHGQSGLLFPSGDAQACTRHLLAVGSDAGLRQNLGSKGRSDMESRNDPAAWTHQYQRVYDQLRTPSE